MVEVGARVLSFVCKILMQYQLSLQRGQPQGDGPVGGGSAGTTNVAEAVTVPLPAGNFTSLRFLGSATNGNQPNQAFSVTYTDGTSTTFTRSVSDWYTPQNYPGETRAATMASRNNAVGATNNGPFYLYSYALALNKAKTVRSISLPGNREVKVLAISLLP
jgi:hypothetical protein